MLPNAYQKDGHTLFPGLTHTQVLEAAKRFWDWDHYSFPIPKQALQCPTCRNKRLQVKNWSLSRHQHKTVKGRCDNTFKCTVCSYVFTFGIPTSEETLNSIDREPHGGSTWRWDEALALMHRRDEITKKDLKPRVHERIHDKYLDNNWQWKETLEKAGLWNG